MIAPTASGAELICRSLKRVGVDCVFGLPGSQNVLLYEALRTSTLRTVVATNELSAAMMANGYYRSSGRPGVLITIPGPGFTWAMTGLAEASLDSAALLHIVGQPAATPGRHFQLQAIDQASMARPIVRAAHRADCAADVEGALAAAHADSLAGEPGPVMLQVARAVLEERTVVATPAITAEVTPVLDAPAIAAVVRALATAKRCVILAGQGCNGTSALLVQLAETLSAAVVTTTSGRGVVAEDHSLSLGFEFAGNEARTLNALIDASDLVLAIGCKFSHNGSRGFRLRLPEDKLVHVDASADVLGANYPARIAIHADARAFMAAALAGLATWPVRAQGFSADELAQWRKRAHAEGLNDVEEPRIHGVRSGKPAEFFAALRRVMPRHSCLVTDSGLHQELARRHFRVLHPRGLITPTNLQSMGFGLGAAIGACFADPGRPVVALIGDGGLMMSGLELLTAVREHIRLTVIVFVDGAYGMIRVQQLEATGHVFATEFTEPDLGALAAAIGASHLRLTGDPDAVLRAALEAPGVTFVEVRLGDSLPMYLTRAKGIAKRTLGTRARTWLRGILRRG